MYFSTFTMEQNVDHLVGAYIFKKCGSVVIIAPREKEMQKNPNKIAPKSEHCDVMEQWKEPFEVFLKLNQNILYSGGRVWRIRGVRKL